MITSKFRSIYMNKIDKNIDLINKMLYEEKKTLLTSQDAWEHQQMSL